ncbi:MAG: GDP-mannose 4,6-dehydratase [candidate division Zixibacteria bacterium]|nr:GDP-mannose 4,6-dehydratase [candidate division Zixibacteria bacterium]
MIRRTALITGIAGFAGSWLAEELLSEGYRVFGTFLPNESLNNIRPIQKQLSLAKLDILDTSACRKLVAAVKPDHIFHLAAIASVGRSFELEQVTFRVNFDGTLSMLEAARQHARLKSFLFIGSADSYGTFQPPTKLLTERQCFNPISPYGIAKSAAEYASRYYHRAHGLPVVIARSFNHSGPRQTDNFVIPSFAKQIAMIEAGRQKPVLMVGDLSAKRDFSDVRDIVRGYRLLAQKGKPGEVYQLCSGKAVSIQHVLDMLISISHADISVKVDKQRLRKADIPMLRGSHAKATRDANFSTRIPLRTTLMDTLAYWREKI